MKIKQKEKGFTIIEVVLVLAIAGLIFMMVFIALPALQRSQRDSQRKNDLSRAITAVTNYTSNNRGALPSDSGWTSFTEQYLTVDNDSFIDPSGPNTSNSSATTYEFKAVSGSTGMTSKFSSDSTQNVIYYARGYVCGSSSGTFTSSGSRKIALAMYLEGGGVTCQNN